MTLVKAEFEIFFAAPKSEAPHRPYMRANSELVLSHASRQRDAGMNGAAVWYSFSSVPHAFKSFLVPEVRVCFRRFASALRFDSCLPCSAKTPLPSMRNCSEFDLSGAAVPWTQFSRDLTV